MPTKSEEEKLVERLQSGDRSAVSEQFASHRLRLTRMIRLRMDRRQAGRVDASDVIQDAHLDATRRLAEYFANPSLPFFIWLRLLTIQKLAELQARHLGTQALYAACEIPLHDGPMPLVKSKLLAAALVGRISSPSSRAMRAELKRCLQAALDQLDPLDREIIALRHFERPANAEAAQVTDLTPSAANSRYFRAMGRLKKVLSESSEFG